MKIDISDEKMHFFHFSTFLGKERKKQIKDFFCNNDENKRFSVLCQKSRYCFCGPSRKHAMIVFQQKKRVLEELIDAF